MLTKIAEFFKIDTRPKFLVQINYKSSISVECWFYQFKYERTNNETEYTYECVNFKSPILLGVDDIESVYQLRMRKWWQIFEL